MFRSGESQNFDPSKTNIQEDTIMNFNIKLEGAGVPTTILNRIQPMINDIVDYYRNTFELLPFKQDDSEHECTVHIENLKCTNNPEDPYGQYSHGNVSVYWPTIFGDAHVLAAENNISEDEALSELLAQTIAHELFHFFHDSCSAKSMYSDNVNFIVECLAEYFAMNYIRDRYETDSYDLCHRKDGDIDSEEGYCAAMLLMQSGVWDRTVSDDIDVSTDKPIMTYEI